MRSLAAFVAETQADIFAVCEIEAGDALALATRFALEWAYRGRQALFWNAVFKASEVADVYLPASGAKQLARRGFLRVNGSLNARTCALYTMQFASDRDEIAQRRFARARLRAETGPALLFAYDARAKLRLDDLGFVESNGSSEARERIWVRDFGIASSAVRAPLAGLGAGVEVRLLRA